MNYWTAYLTDVGIYRKVNQDALLIKTAKTVKGKVLLAAIADGLGGLKCGEVASNTIVHDLSVWFDRELPVIVKGNQLLENVKRSLLGIIKSTHKKLKHYMQERGISMGTTLTLLFLFQDNYLIMHIGDTRVYLYDLHEVDQMTKDHTYVQREIDAGRMSLEQARHSEQKSVLTQCIGASDEIFPEIKLGSIEEKVIFLLCSDGFRNEVSECEIEECLKKAINCDRNKYTDILYEMTEKIKARGEKDNISSLLIKCF